MKELQNRINFSIKPHWVQFILNPLRVIQYLFWTRLAFMLGKPIEGKAKFFFGKEISGFFPEPVFSYIYLHGFFEGPLTQIMYKYLKKDMVFIDVGSHIGDFAILASTLVGFGGKVYAFEPTPSTYKILLKNVEELKNVYTQQMAVWSKSQRMKFKDYGYFYSGCNSYTDARLPDSYLKRIKPQSFISRAISLDEFCRQNRIRPGFVKIDAESAEYMVLLGMRNILSKLRPIVSIEIGDKQKTKSETRNCIEFLNKLGYTAYDIEDSKVKKHVLRQNYYLMYNNLLFLPNK